MFLIVADAGDLAEAKVTDAVNGVIRVICLDQTNQRWNGFSRSNRSNSLRQPENRNSVARVNTRRERVQ